MALGDLSSDQSRFVDLVAQATGLSRDVVVAWVGSESGWGTTKPTHNYLNVGPGESYPSTQLAAARAAALINAGSHYVGIRAAIPAGGGAQVQAIGASPWGTSASLLNNVYGDLTAGSPVVKNVNALSDAAKGVAGALGLGPAASVAGAAGGAVAGAVGDAAGAVGSAVTSGVSEAFTALVPVVLEAGLGLVFTVAAFAFIAMGVNRLTGQGVTKTYNAISGAVGTAAGAAKLAAI